MENKTLIETIQAANKEGLTISFFPPFGEDEYARVKIFAFRDISLYRIFTLFNGIMEGRHLTDAFAIMVP